MQRWIYRLKLLGPLHLGTGRANDGTDLDGLPRSDTLAAALVKHWPAGSTEKRTVLARQPPFAVSSALPIVNDELLLFAPRWLVGRAAERHAAARKLVKPIRFVAPSVLRAWLGGSEELKQAALCGEAWLGAPRTAPLWFIERRTRVAVDRETGGAADGLLFASAALQLADDVSLAIVAEFDSEDVRAPFETALRLLGAAGVGGDRSAGCGQFEIDSAEHWEPPTFGRNGEPMLLSLSLWHPSKAEVESGLLDDPASYGLVARGGWAEVDGAGRLRRKVVQLLTEGSLARDLRAIGYGDSVRVREPEPEAGLDHPVYRLGRAVTLPLMLPRGDA